MIRIARLKGKEFYLNEKLIECIESTPDTIITLNNGHKYIVGTPIEIVIELIKQENNR